MPPYRLLTLGTLGVVDDSGNPVEFPAGKPLAVLVRLAAGPEPPTRRELVHLLWSRSSMERGLQSVRQALWLIRKMLGDDVLAANGVVELRPGAVTSDIADLEQALAENRIEAADALWVGPFLHRFAVGDAPEWDRWVEGVAQDLARRLAAALFAGAVRRREDGDLAGARHGLERAAAIAPFDSRYREELVSLLVELRDLRAAEKALADARQALPEPEQREGLDGLARRVEQLRADRTGVPDERLARPDLVGRSSELADLLAAWRRAEKGHKRIVLLTGPAGIGKTRLADELARTVQHESAATDPPEKAMQQACRFWRSANPTRDGGTGAHGDGFSCIDLPSWSIIASTASRAAPCPLTHAAGGSAWPIESIKSVMPICP